MSGLHERLQQKFPEYIPEIHAQNGDETAYVKRDALLDVARFLRTDSNFKMDMLVDFTAVDGSGMKWNPRFELVYHFLSTATKNRLRLKVRLDEKDLVAPTLSGEWPVANWFEREIWDMFGIRFEGHPDLKRLLMYEEFVGHPLRKDYPITRRQPLIGPKN